MDIAAHAQSLQHGDSLSLSFLLADDASPSMPPQDGQSTISHCVKIWNKPVSLALLRYKRDAGSHGIAWRLRPVWTPAQIHSTLPDLLKTIDRSEQSASDRLEMDDVLIVTKMDRLGRNAMDVTATVDRLAKLGIRVYCLALGGADLRQRGRPHDDAVDQRRGAI